MFDVLFAVLINYQLICVSSFLIVFQLSIDIKTKTNEDDL